jgi:hypothetical protein
MLRVNRGFFVCARDLVASFLANLHANLSTMMEKPEVI